MKKSLIALGALGALALVVTLVTHGSAAPADAGAPCQVDMAITGMTCSMGCAPRVKAALEGVDGVRSAKVVFETSSATVMATGGVCKDKAGEILIQALKDAGYGGSLKALKKAAPARAPGKS